MWETMWSSAVPMSTWWRMVSASHGGAVLHRCLRAVSVAGGALSEPRWPPARRGTGTARGGWVETGDHHRSSAGRAPGDGEGGQEPTGENAGGELRPAQPAHEQAEEPTEADVGHAELAREPKREHQVEAGNKAHGDAGAPEHPPAVAQGRCERQQGCTEGVGRPEQRVGDPAGAQVDERRNGADRPQEEERRKGRGPPDPPHHDSLDRGADETGGKAPEASAEGARDTDLGHDDSRLGRGPFVGMVSVAVSERWRRSVAGSGSTSISSSRRCSSRNVVSTASGRRLRPWRDKRRR